MFRLLRCIIGCMGHETLIDAYSQLRSRLHGMACRLLRDDEDARDALQDAFCNLWSADAPASEAEARNKLLATVRNVCINKLRKKHPERLAPDAPEPAADIPAEDADMDYGPRLMSVLSPLQAKVFTMAVMDDYEYEVIALRLGLSVEAVRTHMSRARKKMIEQYKKIER